MNWVSLLLKPALPELFLGTATLTLLIVDLFIKDQRWKSSYVLSLAIVVISAILQCWVHQEYTYPVYLFANMFVVDSFSTWMKLAIYIATFMVFVYTRPYLTSFGALRSEYFVLSLFALFGMTIMVSATHLLPLYIGLEIVSLALYTLIALQHEPSRVTEAALKYFVLGALASGFLLYGISMIYGATSALHLNVIAQQIAMGTYEPLLLMLGIVFIVCGLAFKLGAVPFHMWIPDVYHGAPMAITLMLSAAPKLAVLAIIFRLLVQTFHAIHVDWQMMFVVLAVLSMAVGNITAIAQTNVKRLLAYSTIAHMGFLLLGFVGHTAASYGATLFYMMTYVLMSLGVFGVLLVLSRRGFECENLDDLKGLNQRNSGYAALLLVILFSMAGIPPTVGFYAKLIVIKTVVGLPLCNTHTDLTWLAVYAVMMSLIGAFYYLRVVKCMYMDKALDRKPIKTNPTILSLLSLNAVALLILGMLPNGLMTLCMHAIEQSFKTM